ncbi:MAG TPA: FHA domain-containing protein, partial [Ktedonobacterales bacterium]|nr:FHA domain-containing protein [Ktedonobacterales bacterium]
LPFMADAPMGIVFKHMHDPVPRPAALAPGLPPRVEHIILRAMEKNPNMRFQRAREMADQLREAALEVRRGSGGGGGGRAPQPTVRREGAPAGIPAPARGIPGAPGTCLRCGAGNDPRNLFCTTCGYDLSGSRARADRYLTPGGVPLRCRIVLRNGPLAGQAFLLHQDVTTLGRGAGNDVMIPDGTISRAHARLFFAKRQWLIEDLGSSNGTFVNGQRVAGRPVPLKHGDELRLGDDFLLFELVG